MKNVFIPILLVVALASCSSEHSDKKKDGPPTYMIYSPNGEPLNGGSLGKPSCEKALSGWFDRLSAGQNGLISQEAFLNDAKTQFARMDIDHNGYLVSEELDRFREPYRQQPPVADRQEENKTDVKSQIAARKHKQDDSSGGRKGSDSNNDATLSDPVMSADTNLDFKVTSEEFLTQAREVFAKLDSNHDGSLDSAEVLALCPKKKGD